MKINLEINNMTDSPVEAGFFEAVVKRTFVEINYIFLENTEVEISVALVAEDEMQKLNKEYRKNDSVTDILSFPEFRSKEELENRIEKKNDAEVFLGELILCYNDIKEYAEKKGLKLENELANTVSHGILHLLGFEHGDEMFKIQQAVINSKS